jgi:hypothetical protein
MCSLVASLTSYFSKEFGSQTTNPEIDHFILWNRDVDFSE